jgi:predicted amidohydrolase
MKVTKSVQCKRQAIRFRIMKISVLQFSPLSNKSLNIEVAESLASRSVQSDRPDLVVLPEVWTCLGGTAEQKFDAAENIPPVGSTKGGGPAVEALRRIARSNGIHVHGGSIAEVDGDRLLNTSIVVSPSGEIVGRYSKIHLFDVVTPNGQQYRESDTYSAGEHVVTVRVQGSFGSFRLGLAICYDLRFGLLFDKLREQGADVVVLPAAFTVETGAAHWETLIRARAIDTQCWFAAAGTVDAYLDAKGEKRMTHGHSMIVDPWGTVVARVRGGEGFATAGVDLSLTECVRNRIPIMEHRRIR